VAEVGSLLRRYREVAGLSQEELAERAGVSARGVSDLERGLRRSPYPATLRRLAVALDLAPEDRAALLAAAHGGTSQERQTRAAVVEQGAYLGSRAPAGLVGRRREVAGLREELEAALAGSGRLTLLTGEAGIGKTRLAQEFAAMAATNGFGICTGRCYEPFQAVAFYPFLDALGDLYAAAPIDIREQLVDRWPYMQRLLPDVFPQVPRAPSDGPDELQRLLRSAAGFIRACAERSPVALFVDDLQWADRASIDLLQHLVRHTRGQRVLLAGTVREPGLGSTSTLRRAMVDLHREGLLHQVRLDRLTREEIADLLSERLETGEPASDLIDVICSVSAGNPFFAIELLHTLQARSELVLNQTTWTLHSGGSVVVPESVRENILDRYARLSSNSARVIDAAAALGQVFAIDDLVAIAGLGEEQAEAALDEVVTAGLLRPVAEAEHAAAAAKYAFVHELTHRALYQHLPPHRRRRLHLRAAEALVHTPEHVQSRRAAEIARHFQAANERGRALPYLLLAGDQAEAVFAHHDATEHYQAAVLIASEIHDRSAEARAQVGLGRSWLAGGHPERALQHFEDGVRIYRQLADLEAEGETLAHIAQVYFARGQWDAGIQRLPEIIERLERRAPSRALALLYACLAAVMPSSSAERLAAANRASKLARALSDDDLLVQAEANRGFVLMLAGQLPEARATLEAILPLAETRGSYDALPMVLGALGEMTKLKGDIPGYLTLAERAVARAEQAGDPVALIGALSGVAEANYLLGDWVAARRTYERAAREGADLDAAWYRGFVHLGLAAIDVAEGNWSSVEQQLAECLVDRPRLGHQNRREHALRLLARRDLLADAPSSALARLDDVVRAEGDEHAGTQALRAWALLESAELASATDAVARAIEIASAQANQLDLCEALLVRGEVERRRGDADRACSTFMDALDLAAAMPCPYLEARARYGHARVLADLRRVEDCAAELQLAVTTLLRLGATPFLQKAERLLASLAERQR
jgi:transcriptional regulator with XRE-family HTH domain/tetratricopeptide (TPR) repeat protein